MRWLAGPVYRDRREAGERLAERLLGYREAEPVVLGAPRGGVAVAVPIAAALEAPLDVVLAKKLPAPGMPELGFGAVGEGGGRVLDERIVSELGLTEEQVEAITEETRRELEERARRYRGARPAIELLGRTAVVVDDGLATGVTLAAAVEAARARGARRVIAAAPVASTEAQSRLEAAADEFVCLLVDPLFTGVGAYYAEFPQLSDDDVIELLEAAGG